VDPSRRGFLAQAAVAAAGGATLGLALPLPGSSGAAERVPDPILQAIEAHKVARAAFEASVSRHSALEKGGRRWWNRKTVGRDPGAIF
jgi:hypothetical protein